MKGPICKLTNTQGLKKEVSCIFPFQYQDLIFKECTAFNDPEGKFWCSTKVDEVGHHVVGQNEWGYCDPDCETEVPQTPIKFRLVEKRLSNLTVLGIVHIRGIEYHLTEILFKKKKFRIFFIYLKVIVFLIIHYNILTYSCSIRYLNYSFFYQNL